MKQFSGREFLEIKEAYKTLVNENEMRLFPKIYEGVNIRNLKRATKTDGSNDEYERERNDNSSLADTLLYKKGLGAFKSQFIRDKIPNALLGMTQRKQYSSDRIMPNRAVVKRAYDKFNEKYFNSILPKIDVVNIKIVRDNGRPGGGKMYASSAINSEGDVELTFLDSPIEEYKFFDHLLHEMIHIEEQVKFPNGRDKSVHGPFFMSEVKRLNKLGWHIFNGVSPSEEGEYTGRHRDKFTKIDKQRNKEYRDSLNAQNSKTMSEYRLMVLNDNTENTYQMLFSIDPKSEFYIGCSTIEEYEDYVKLWKKTQKIQFKKCYIYKITDAELLLDLLPNGPKYGVATNGPQTDATLGRYIRENKIKLEHSIDIG